MAIAIPNTDVICLLDAYTTNDIIYKWEYEKVKVETKGMAQFDFNKAFLSTSVESFSIGK